MQFSFMYDHAKGDLLFEDYNLDDDSKELIHKHLTRCFDNMLKGNKLIIVGDIWCYESKKYRNFNPESSKSQYSTNIRVCPISQSQIDRHVKEVELEKIEN